MTAETARAAAGPLKDAANRAMAAGDLPAAAAHFEQALALAPDQVELWLGLAACRRGAGDLAGALAAVTGALQVQPRYFPALLMQGSLLEGLGKAKAAAQAYKNAIAVAPPVERMAGAMRQAFERGRAVHDRYAADLAAHLRAAANLGATGSRVAGERRLETFIEALAGRRRIYQQEPVRFHYPELPAIEFHDRDAFPWLAGLEARTADIRREAIAAMASDAPHLRPYINYPDDIPVDQWAELNRSPRWSAYHLIEDGAPIQAHLDVCPATAAALAAVGQPDLPGRSPSAMFSILSPRTRIPPHTGAANVRLIVHLPLIVPEGCAFRVGGQTRPWREGEAWVFDDTIEHEAWNDSDRPRTVLIFDVWNPAVPEAERGALSALMVALDAFTEEPAKSEL